MDMSPVGRFAYSKSECYCNNKVFMMTGAHLKYLCVVLNSSLVSWYVAKTARTTGIGLPQWEAFVVASIPVPRVDSVVSHQFELAFDAAHEGQRTAERALGTENMVNGLYGLTAAQAQLLNFF